MKIDNVWRRVMRYIKAASSPEELAEARAHPTGTDIAMRHPRQDAGVHVRDDGAVEIQSGATAIVVDGNTGIVSVAGRGFVTDVQRTSFRTQQSGFSVNNGFLNPAWLPDERDLPYMDIAPLLNPDVLARSPATINPAYLPWTIDMRNPVNPAAPVPVPVVDLLKPRPLFRRRDVFTETASVLQQILMELG